MQSCGLTIIGVSNGCLVSVEISNPSFEIIIVSFEIQCWSHLYRFVSFEIALVSFEIQSLRISISNLCFTIKNVCRYCDFILGWFCFFVVVVWLCGDAAKMTMA